MKQVVNSVAFIFVTICVVATSSFADESGDCLFDGRAFKDGALVPQGASIFKCSSGNWDNAGIGADNIVYRRALYCWFEDRKYSPGALIVENKFVLACSDQGEWQQK